MMMKLTLGINLRRDIPSNNGPIHTQYFCTQYWDKKMLQLKDKKTFFIKYFFPV